MKRPFEAYRSEHEANMALQRAAQRFVQKVTNNAKPCTKGYCNSGRECDCDQVVYSGAMHPSQWIPRDRGIHGPYHVPLRKRWAARWERFKAWFVDPVVRS